MFQDIDIQGIDEDKIEPVGAGTHIVPYVLSTIPPTKWVSYFLETINGSGFITHTSNFSRTSDLPIAGTTKINDDRVYFTCKGDAQSIRKGGVCWRIVEAHAVDANKRYRKFEEQKIRENEMQRQTEEQKSRELDDLKRELKKD